MDYLLESRLAVIEAAIHEITGQLDADLRLKQDQQTIMENLHRILLNLELRVSRLESMLSLQKK